MKGKQQISNIKQQQEIKKEAGSPTKQQERQIILEPIFDHLIKYDYWQYRDDYQKETEGEMINNFLQSNKKALQKLLKDDLYDNMKVLSQQMGLHLHPIFKNKPQVIQDNNGDQFSNILQSEQNASPQNIKQTYLCLTQVKLDFITCKLLAFLLKNCQTLRFQYNELNENCFRVLIEEMAQPQKIEIKAFLNDWNAFSIDFQIGIYPKIIQEFTNLEFLSLRASQISNQTVKKICALLIEQQEMTQLKYIDLYGNEISGEGINSIAEVLFQNRKIEGLNVAKNKLSKFKDIEKLLSMIGKHQISVEQAEEYKKQQQNRLEIIERNKKQKIKAKHEQVPFLYELDEDIENNQFYLLKNLHFQTLDFSQNQFDNLSLPNFEKFCPSLGENQKIILKYNNFKFIDKNEKKQMNNQLENKIIL